MVLSSAAMAWAKRRGPAKGVTATEAGKWMFFRRMLLFRRLPGSSVRDLMEMGDGEPADAADAEGLLDRGQSGGEDHGRLAARVDGEAGAPTDVHRHQPFLGDGRHADQRHVRDGLAFRRVEQDHRALGGKRDHPVVPDAHDEEVAGARLTDPLGRHQVHVRARWGGSGCGCGGDRRRPCGSVTARSRSRLPLQARGRAEPAGANEIPRRLARRSALGGGLRLPLGGVVLRTYRGGGASGLDGWSARALLDRVRQFVSPNVPALRRAGLIAACTEEHVLTVREGTGVQLPGGLSRGSVGVQAHAAQVATEGVFHWLAQLCRHRTRPDCPSAALVAGPGWGLAPPAAALVAALIGASASFGQMGLRTVSRPRALTASRPGDAVSWRASFPGASGMLAAFGIDVLWRRRLAGGAQDIEPPEFRPVASPTRVGLKSAKASRNSLGRARRGVPSDRLDLLFLHAGVERFLHAQPVTHDVIELMREGHRSAPRKRSVSCCIFASVSALSASVIRDETIRNNPRESTHLTL